MQKEKITLEVSQATAQAYERASDLEKQRAASALGLALQAPGNAADELEQLLERMSRRAAERGLTEEKLRGLLEEDSPDDEPGDA